MPGLSHHMFPTDLLNSRNEQMANRNLASKNIPAVYRDRSILTKTVPWFCAPVQWTRWSLHQTWVHPASGQSVNLELSYCPWLTILWLMQQKDQWQVLASVQMHLHERRIRERPCTWWVHTLASVNLKLPSGCTVACCTLPLDPPRSTGIWQTSRWASTGDTFSCRERKKRTVHYLFFLTTVFTSVQLKWYSSLPCPSLWVFVNITIMVELCSHSMRQKSSVVSARGPLRANVGPSCTGSPVRQRRKNTTIWWADQALCCPTPRMHISIKQRQLNWVVLDINCSLH